tara:strand:- start:975 stop:1250 length:276 start_codon:yes stop_codon:yes gene_type:complete
MSLGKKDIVCSISTKAFISNKESHKVLNHFIKTLLSKSKNSFVKISNFGTFYTHYSPMRVGRNPKTKEEFPIAARNKLAFKSSNKVKNILN